MIFGQSKLEMKVGIFVFIGLVILITFVLSIKDFKNITSGYEINFIFNFANGVKIGAPIRFAGVDVGEIKEINFVRAPDDPKPKVRIMGSINKDIKVPLDSTVWVNTLGLLGEKYIEIMPGEDYSKFLSPRQSLVGVDPIPMHEVSVLAKDIAQNLNDSIAKIKKGEGTIGRLFYDDTLYKELEAAIKNREGTIGRLLYNDALYKELEALILDIRKHPWKLFWKTKEKKK